jgi:hypothetical protein
LISKKHCCYRKSIGGVTVFSNFAANSFSGNLFPIGISSSHTGSNDTGLMSVCPPGAESIAGQTNTDIK